READRLEVRDVGPRRRKVVEELLGLGVRDEVVERAGAARRGAAVPPLEVRRDIVGDDLHRQPRGDPALELLRRQQGLGGAAVASSAGASARSRTAAISAAGTNGPLSAPASSKSTRTSILRGGAADAAAETPIRTATQTATAAARSGRGLTGRTPSASGDLRL